MCSPLSVSCFSQISLEWIFCWVQFALDCVWSKWRPAGKFPDRVWECLFYSFEGNLLWASLRHARLSLPTVPLCWNRASIMKFSPSWQKKISFNTCTICALECQWVPSNRKLSSKWNKTNADAISKIEKKTHQGTLQFSTGVIYTQKCVKSFKQRSLFSQYLFL